MLDLFADDAPWQEPLMDGAVILRRRVRDSAAELMAQVNQIAAQNPFEHRITPGGHKMSVAMTNCGDLGWSTDSRGYQYSAQDDVSGKRWPAMPASFRELAVTCAAEAGFSGFSPDACLINRYEPGAKLTLHQDKDERDLRQPIVSVSLGLPAVFLLVVLSALTPASACCWSRGMWWSGAGHHVCVTTVFCRSNRHSIRSPGLFASI